MPEDWVNSEPLPFTPKVEWTLSDGTACSYWENELITRQCKS